ncbi:uncharacterized protein LOC121735403 [Aricia agestis]|uniref:uncharacterized protein LOC121735403 n=1 Tax=Aricia agestis TaxID=91739 RepID=UPI001C207048|nr:uncharacterized protein LOC121735403 [Aricia agestis]
MNAPDTNFKNDINTIILNLMKLLPKKKDAKLYKDDKFVRHMSGIHSEAKSVFPLCFSGLRLGAQSEFGTVKLVQNYRFGSDRQFESITRLLQKEVAPKRVDDGLVLDLTRSAVATYTKKVNNGHVRFISTLSDLTASENEMVVERRNESYMSLTSFSIKNGNFANLRILTQYMYRLLPVLCVGGEFAFSPFGENSPKISFGYRYDLPSMAISGTISQLGLQICFFNELSKELRVATVATQTLRGTVLSLALHKVRADSDLKVFVDSRCCVGATFEKNLLFEEATATRLIKMRASSLVDKRGRIHFGLGFDLDF